MKPRNLVLARWRVIVPSDFLAWTRDKVFHIPGHSPPVPKVESIPITHYLQLLEHWRAIGIATGVENGRRPQDY